MIHITTRFNINNTHNVNVYCTLQTPYFIDLCFEIIFKVSTSVCISLSLPLPHIHPFSTCEYICKRTPKLLPCYCWNGFSFLTINIKHSTKAYHLLNSQIKKVSWGMIIFHIIYFFTAWGQLKLGRKKNTPLGIWI